MRHRRKAKYFGVKTAHRKAMFRNMVTSLFRHGRITTTLPRAKELRRLADKLVTLAKEGSLHARRQALSVINDKTVVARLFSEIADQMASRTGGYTRIVRIGPRRGDGAMMCIIELVRESIKPQKAKSSRPRKEEAASTVIPQAMETPAEKSESEQETEEALSPEESAVEEAEEALSAEVTEEVSEEKTEASDEGKEEEVSAPADEQENDTAEVKAGTEKETEKKE